MRCNADELRRVLLESVLSSAIAEAKLVLEAGLGCDVPVLPCAPDCGGRMRGRVEGARVGAGLFA